MGLRFADSCTQLRLRPSVHAQSRNAKYANASSTIELKENTVIVVLGASGDLAKKKTVCEGGKSMLPLKLTALQ